MSLHRTNLSAFTEGTATVLWECFLCWRTTRDGTHTGKPWYEATSLPSGIVLRCCEAGMVMQDEDRDHLGDLWLDAQIERGRAFVGAPQIWKVKL